MMDKINEILDTFSFLNDKEINAYLSVDKTYLQDNILPYAFSGNCLENLRKIFNIIPKNIILDIIDSKTIKKFLKNNPQVEFSIYRIFLILIEAYGSDIISDLMSDDGYKSLLLECSDNLVKVWPYFTFEDIKNLVTFAFKTNQLYASFTSVIPLDYQISLLDSDFKTEELIELVSKLSIDAQSEFFTHDKRATYLYKYFNLNHLVMNGVKYSREILLKNDFYESLFIDDLVEFNYLITMLEVNTDYPIIVRNKANEFYENVINNYNPKLKIFNEYIPLLNDPNYYYTCEYENIYYYDLEQESYEKEDLEKITNRKLSDVIILLLFQDNYYNVILNIKELLRFNKHVSLLSEEKITFYNIILNIDALTSEEKISMYHRLKNSSLNMILYSDIRLLKDKSYDYINSSLLNFKNSSFYEEDGAKIYDFRNKEFYMLVRRENKHQNITKNPSSCYSLISNDGTSTIYTVGKNYDGFIYGYFGFNKDNVLHVLETDAYSGRYDGMMGNTSLYVNRISTPHELISSTNFYNELEITNKKLGDRYESLMPDYIVCYDAPREVDIKEAKRLNIPICIVEYKLLSRDDGIMFDVHEEAYSFLDENCFIKNKR